MGTLRRTGRATVAHDRYNAPVPLERPTLNAPPGPSGALATWRPGITRDLATPPAHEMPPVARSRARNRSMRGMCGLLLAVAGHSFAASHEVAGLEQPAEILVDTWGVPHIYARTHYDAFFVQGFNAARDRLWQIDLWRRRGLGQLSEVLGERFVEQDRANRLFGLSRRHVSGVARVRLGRQAHCRGVRRRDQRLCRTRT